MTDSKNKYLWWHNGIIYQIYPRSFQDSNGDGVGDLPGITKRLDYLKWLGIEALWISPIYPSPMADFGYDISDYQDIHPIFGTFNDFEVLLTEIHRRGMKLILDLVPNHTSDQHPWFLESKSSKNNPKRNWYLWKDGKEDGSVPNNWRSVFGGSAWEWDENTQQYYYHGFLKEQPDLNWRNPEVQEMMLNVMRFWLDKGVDGFRVDVMWHMIKDEKWRDNPVNPDYKPHMSTYDELLPVYSTDQPEVHEIIRKMREVLDSYGERMMIGEIYLPIHKLMSYYGVDNKGAHLPFNFQLLSLPWDSRQIATAIDEYEGVLPDDGWPNWILSNHDNPRITSRVGVEQAKVAAVMLLTLRGTPTVYYGDEIGMRDVPIPFEEVQDPQGLNMPDKNLSRDPARTPMQWNSGEKAGFTDGKPWLRIDKLYSRINVDGQKGDSHSTLSLYKRLIELRQKEDALMFGDYIPVYSDSQIIVYERAVSGSSRFMVILNLSHRPCYFKSKTPLSGMVELATSPELEGTRIAEHVSLSGDEAIVVRLGK
jgi:alpha-glucosidase